MDIPKWSDPKARRVYLVVGGAAAGYVVYRWWQSQSGTTVIDDQVGSGSVIEGGGGGVPASGNVQYGGADVSQYPASISTDAQWVQAATQLLVDQAWDGQLVQAALGRFLTDQLLTSEQERIVRAALAAAGPPPGGTHTILTGADDDTSDDTDDETGKPPGIPTGARTVWANRTTIHVVWAPTPGATGYEFYREWNSTGTQVKAPSAWISGARPGTKYHWRIRAKNEHGWGPWSGPKWSATLR